MYLVHRPNVKFVDNISWFVDIQSWNSVLFPAESPVHHLLQYQDDEG